MKCPICKLVEMMVNKIENGNVEHICKKCGNKETEKIPEESN